MLSTEEDNISVIMDEALESYTIPEEDKTRRHEINEKIDAFKNYLGPALLPEFLDILDMINAQNSRMAETTFRLGFECREACEKEKSY